MRFKINGNWKEGFSHDGMLYCAQRIEEMLMFFTSHLYKVPVLNTYLLIEEYLTTFGLVKSGMIHESHLKIILDEFCDSLKNDIVIKEHFSASQIEYFSQHLNELSQENQKKFMAYLFHKFVMYPVWCGETVKKYANLEKDKKKIENALRCYIPMLIRIGYDQSYIYYYCKSTFSSREIKDTSPLDKFVDDFDFHEHLYEIRFSADKKVYNFKDILKQRLDIKIVNENASRSNTNGNILLSESVKALDPESAAHLAYQNFDIFTRYYKFLGNREGEWCDEKASVYDEDGKRLMRTAFSPAGFRFSQDYDDKTLGKNSERIITSLLEKANHKDFRTVDKLIVAHNQAIDSSNNRNAFLNLWSAIEIIGASDDRSNSKIVTIIRSVVPILKRNYINVVIHELHDYLKANLDINDYNSLLSSISQNGDEEYKLACLVILEEYENVRKSAYQMLKHYPVIRSRISQLHEDVFKNKKKYLTELERYGQRIEWHIQRLYRTRNSIIHSGNEPNNIVSLGEHLHEYVDELVLEILERITQPDSLTSIDNVIIDSQTFMDRISGKEFQKNQKFAEDDVKLIFYRD
jgi:hypothetical protein